MMDKLQRDLAACLTPGSSPDAPLRASGTRIWTCGSGVHCIEQLEPLYVSYDVSAKVLPRSFSNTLANTT